MKIRAKIVMVVLPLLITTLFLSGISATYSARAGITRIAQEFLDFKATEVRKYAQGQWGMLEENQLTSRAEYVEAAKKAVEEYARSLVRSETELTVAFDDEGQVEMATSEVEITTGLSEGDVVVVGGGYPGLCRGPVAGRDPRRIGL